VTMAEDDDSYSFPLRSAAEYGQPYSGLAGINASEATQHSYGRDAATPELSPDTALGYEARPARPLRPKGAQGRPRQAQPLPEAFFVQTPSSAVPALQGPDPCEIQFGQRRTAPPALGPIRPSSRLDDTPELLGPPSRPASRLDDTPEPLHLFSSLDRSGPSNAPPLSPLKDVYISEKPPSRRVDSAPSVQSAASACEEEKSRPLPTGGDASLAHPYHGWRPLRYSPAVHNSSPGQICPITSYGDECDIAPERTPSKGRLPAPTLPQCKSSRGNSKGSARSGPGRAASKCSGRPGDSSSSTSPVASPDSPQSAQPHSPFSEAAEPLHSQSRSGSVRASSHNVHHKKKPARDIIEFRKQLERDPILGTLVKRMFAALALWNKAHMVHSSLSWAEVFSKIDLDKSGRLSFDHFAAVVCDHLRTGISRYELRMLWRHLDEDNSGLVCFNEFSLLLYRIELASWPNLSPESIYSCVQKLNSAANYWHRSGGNWFKIFTEIDADDSGYVSFEEFRQCVRGPFPGLRQNLSEISEIELLGMWKALDDHLDVEVSVAKFMTFMRQNAGTVVTEGKFFSCRRTLSHNPTKGRYHRNLERAETRMLTCTRVQLREITCKLETAMKAQWSAMGVQHTVSTTNTHGTSLGNWTRFFEEQKISRARRITYDNLKAQILHKLGALSTLNVTDADLKHLWKYLEETAQPTRFSEITAKDMSAALYKLELENFPDMGEADLCRVVEEMNAAARRRFDPGSGANWANMCSLVDPSGTGHIGYMHMKSLIRHPGSLAMDSDLVSDLDIRALWKAMDRHVQGHVTSAHFMAFMRNHSFNRGKPIHTQRQDLYARYQNNSQALHSSATFESSRDISAELMSAPQVPAARLCIVVKTLTAAVQSWLASRHQSAAVGPGCPGLWARLIKFAAKGEHGRLTFAELETAVTDELQMGQAVSSDELKAFWCLIDGNNSGEATAAEFDDAIYRLQLSSWPKLEDASLTRIVGVLNAAADHWYRCSGNWYKVFVKFDEDGSGTMEFQELVEIVRKNFPGLSVGPDLVSIGDLQGLWRALDADCSGVVVANEFMVFMRKYGEGLAMHKVTQYSKHKREASGSPSMMDLGPPPKRSQEELRETIVLLERALASYWARRGVSMSAFSGGWDNFFEEVATNTHHKRLALPNLKDGLQKRLRLPSELRKGLGSTKSSVESQSLTLGLGSVSEDDVVIKGVSADDLRALWCRVDVDGSGEVSAGEWKLALYKIELEFWPCVSEAALNKVVEKMNDAAEKWHQAGGNWYKIFSRLDSDQSGSMEFDEMKAMLRRPLPCLAISRKIISDSDLRALWKALDTDDNDPDNNVTVQEFMVFMRRRAIKQKVQVKTKSVCHGTQSTRLSVTSQATSELSHEQSYLLAQALARESYDSVADIYASWERPFCGSVSELDWLKIVRELSNIPEDELGDDAVHFAWCMADPAGLGQVPVEAILALRWQLMHTNRDRSATC